MKKELNYAEVNVIMGIYNCEDTLEEAVGCIAAQTFQNWILILCDDGSTDRTAEVAEKIRKAYPEKVVLLKNRENRGLNFTLNRCLAYANCKYIARMDGDDRCAPERFQAEIEVLDREPDIAIVSSDMAYFDESGSWGKISHPEYPCRQDFITGSPFCHAPCMVRKEALDAVGGYSESKYLLRVEDYHLWMKMYLNGFKGKNIHRVLYEMRDDRNAYNRRKFKYRINEAYVKTLVVKKFELSPIYYCTALRPILVGILPGFIYDRLHKGRLQKGITDHE